MDRPVDLRSDTVTRPTPAMRRAMADAEVGDDVLGDDPTVIALEKQAASRLGKQAALFVPSGSMGNNIAIRVHTRPGDEILLDEHAHSLCYEVGGPAALSGVQTRQFRSTLGVPIPEEIAAAITPESLHAPGTTLIVLENTHNWAGGAVLPLSVVRAIGEVARNYSVRVHLDGARLFNATIASGVDAAQFAAEADSVSFCLSKGLGCPVGSLLCGTREFVERARRVRKQFGGGMRQAGILAACGLIALDCMVDRLADDHRRAKALAGALAELPGIKLNAETVQTNMIYLNTEKPAQQLVDALAAGGILCLASGPHRIRLVTHNDVDDDGIVLAANTFAKLLARSG